MNTALMIAAALNLVTAGIHVFAGGPEIMRPIRATTELSHMVKAVAEVVWHGVTVVLVLMAVAMGWIALYPNPPLFWMIIGVQLGFAALFIFYGLLRLGDVKTMPQWIIFTLVPLFSLWAVYG